MLQRLLSSEPLLRIELQQLLHQVQCIIWCIWEHVTQLVGVGVGLHHGLHHGLGILGVHSFNVVRRRHSCKVHTDNLTKIHATLQPAFLIAAGHATASSSAKVQDVMNEVTSLRQSCSHQQLCCHVTERCLCMQMRVAECSSSAGRPVTSTTLSSWFIVDAPGNMGLPPKSSPSMQPEPHEWSSKCINATVHGVNGVTPLEYKELCQACFNGTC